MHELVGERARELHREQRLNFCDDVMEQVLSAKSGFELSIETILEMTESWWQYHVSRWARSEDTTMRELSQRLLRRQPFKHFERSDENRKILSEMVQTSGLDPRYFYFEMADAPVNLKKDLGEAIKVSQRNGTVVPLSEHSAFMSALKQLEALPVPGFIAVPQDIFKNFTKH